MGCKGFDIGFYSHAKDLLEPVLSLTPEEVLRRVPMMKKRNAKGESIFMRPARDSASALVLVDDISRADAMGDGLVRRGLAPVAVVETSPDRFQAWIRLSSPEAQPPAVRGAVAKSLAVELRCDDGSAAWEHFGRLAGFTNNKPERVINGRAPYARHHARDASAVAQRGAELVRQALASLAKVATDNIRERIREEVRKDAATLPKAPPQPAYQVREAGTWYQRTIARLRGFFKAEFDASRADWMAACALYSKGYHYEAVAGAIQAHSPGLEERKGKFAQDYIQATAGKAEIWTELQAEGEDWDSVKEQLLDLAKARSAQRQAAGQASEGQAPQQPRNRGG
jgi:hypothetical protein